MHLIWCQIQFTGPCYRAMLNEHCVEPLHITQHFEYTTIPLQKSKHIHPPLRTIRKFHKYLIRRKRLNIQHAPWDRLP